MACSPTHSKYLRGAIHHPPLKAKLQDQLTKKCIIVTNFYPWLCPFNVNIASIDTFRSPFSTKTVISFHFYANSVLSAQNRNHFMSKSTNTNGTKGLAQVHRMLATDGLLEKFEGQLTQWSGIMTHKTARAAESPHLLYSNWIYFELTLCLTTFHKLLF